jgi:hypothetical protein
MALAIVAAAAPIHKHCNLYDYRGVKKQPDQALVKFEEANKYAPNW